MDCSAHAIVSRVGQLVGEEFWLLRAVGGEVDELRDELATMNALLRMYSETEAGAVDLFLREWMKQLRELAYDAEDCVDLYIFRIKSRKGDGFLLWSKRMVATLFPRHLLAGRIKDLRLRAIAISERHARYGAVNRKALRASRSLAPVAAVSMQTLRPANHTGKLVGIENQVKDLAKRVEAMKNEQEDRRKVFSIVGFGGLGKTTLDMEVCRKLEPDFDRQALVSVSQAFDAGKDLSMLLKGVFQQMVKPKADNEKIIKEEDFNGAGIDWSNVSTVASELENLLRNKRYLIVIDDVWTIAAWDAIRSNLPDGKHGSRVIVTTRINSVAKECSDVSATEDYIHHMQPLILKDSRMLFLSTSGSSMDDAVSYTKEFKDILDKILKKCAGLPLAIVSIASLLAGYKYPERKDMWETVWKSIGSQMESNPTLEGMRHILTLSYNHLPYHLKGCMMYLGIFPEDYEIPRDRLLYRWIAEGLVEEMRGLTLIEVAEGYFEELLSRSMIAPASSISFHGKWDACRVHDMMLEVMVSKSLEANFISLMGGQYEGMSYDRIRRLSIHGGANNSPSMKGGVGVGPFSRHCRRNNMEKVDMQHVRSLSMFELQEKKLFDRLSEFTLLRVLDLEDCEGLENKHVEDICKMYLLRFLSMKGTDISVLPEEVGELEHLQVLDVDRTKLEVLPKTITRLEKLERLKFRNKNKWNIMWKPPAGICKMKVLRSAGCVIIGDNQVAKELGELGDLRGVTIFVDVSSSDSTEDVFETLVNSISKLYSLRYLGIGTFWGLQLSFLNGMRSPPKLLGQLYLDGPMDEFPSWILSLHNLVDISFIWSRLKNDQVFGVLCNLPSLKILTMWRDAYVDEELVARTTHNFPVLKTLNVASLHCYHPGVIKFEQGSMDKLEELSVWFSCRRRRLVGIKHLKNLKKAKLICKKENKDALADALHELKTENKRRLDSEQLQFTIGVQYE